MRLWPVKVRARIGVATAVALVASGCCPTSDYQGDGTVVSEECGPFPNYAVEFSRLDLARPGSHSFRSTGLPRLRAIAGLELLPPPGVSCAQAEQSEIAAAALSLTLTDQHGATLVEHAGPLTDWIWGSPVRYEGCFLYADSLYIDPPPDATITFTVGVDAPSRLHVQLVPTIKSFAVYLP